jgi:HEPN domain-containing protein
MMAENIKEKVEYWLDIADYDLDSVRAMLETKRYLYVGFLCHQVVEKCLKAMYWHRLKKEPPYIHNLLVLAEKVELDTDGRDDVILLFNQLMPLNIQARYPEDKELLLQSLTMERCKDILHRTEEFSKWIKTLLK